MTHQNPIPVREQPARRLHVPESLKAAPFLLLRIDSHTTPMQERYSGPHKVIQRTDKHVTLQLQAGPTVVAWDRVKEAILPNIHTHIPANQSVPTSPVPPPGPLPPGPPHTSHSSNTSLASDSPRSDTYCARGPATGGSGSYKDLVWPSFEATRSLSTEYTVHISRYRNMGISVYHGL